VMIRVPISNRAVSVLLSQSPITKSFVKSLMTGEALGVLSGRAIYALLVMRTRIWMCERINKMIPSHLGIVTLLRQTRANLMRRGALDLEVSIS